MSFHCAGLPLDHVVVIGSGQIGPDIALYFAKVLAEAGGRVTVVDVSPQALAAGRARCDKKIAKGMESGAFKPNVGAAMQAALAFTADYSAIATADLVLEAATEDEALKRRIFAQVEGLVRPDTVLLSNSSHLEPELIFGDLAQPGRSAVAHWFFPAERNPMVEIVPGAATDAALVGQLLAAFEAIGKVPVRVGSRYGYAADPIFEGVFAAACLAVQAGLGNVKEVDTVARGALGMGVGPFTAMNLTGGNPITQHGLGLMHTRLMPWFQSPALLDAWLKDQPPGTPWPVAARGEVVEVAPDRTLPIADAMRGAYLGLAFGMIDSGIVTLDDFELLVEMALDMTPPCRLANRLGVAEALRLVATYAATYEGFVVPTVLQRQAAAAAPFTVSNLVQRDVQVAAGQAVRVITVRRPKVLNALDADTYHQIAAAVAAVARDASVVGAVLTGFGPKAFVSGADIHALRAVRTPDDGYAIAKLGQDLARRIETLGKPVVAALNGIAFGGGLELAMGCRARVAVAGLRVLCGQPEVNLGIIPAAGGTQRLPRLVGLDAANRMLRTGAPIGSDDALGLGLVARLCGADVLVQVAVNLVHGLASGLVSGPALPEHAMAAVAPDLAAVDIGHRSRMVDALLCDAIRVGWTCPLDAGLAHELEVFRRVCALEDMRIGVEHFVAHGARTPAPFVHG
ncbi:MAG: hypothetical protein EXR79_15650 [Myxococcales bacterium]|nr:hypothetical protein [Myxococcales bacterium]